MDSAGPSKSTPSITSQPSPIQLGDLSNEIHPIFEQSNFHPSIAYATIGPVGQLASRFLQTEMLLPFWHAAFFSRARKIRDTRVSHRNYPSFELDAKRHSRLTAAQTKRTKRALARLGSQMNYISGKRMRLPRLQIVRKQYVIIIPDAAMANLLEFAKKGREMYTWSVFELAIAILHLLAHVVMHAATGHAARHYFHGSNATEHGYELESSMFGGPIAWRPADCHSTVHESILLLSWPGAMLTAPQHVHGNIIGLRGRPPPFDTKGELVGQVPFVYIESLFQESFWVKMEKLGPEALRPTVTSWRRMKVPSLWRTNL